MDEKTICAMCKEEIKESDEFHDVNEGRVCQECFEDCYFTCSICGWDLHLDNLSTFDEPEDNICYECTKKTDFDD